MAEAELAGIAEQQVEAHRGDDEDAGDDQHVQDVQVADPQRDRERGTASQAAVAARFIRSAPSARTVPSGLNDQDER